VTLIHGQKVKISETPGCMTHSGKAIGYVPDVFAEQVGEVLAGPDSGDYLIQLTDGKTAWIAAEHLS